MVTIEQLISTTRAAHPRILANARQVSVTLKKARKRKDADGDPYQEVTAICRGATIPRNVTMKIYGRGDKNSKIWASCDCEWFLYYCEVALTKRGSSEVIYSNGKDPKITNPRKLSVACKHILSCILHGLHKAK
jgi:hypothetical protein